MKIVGHNLFRNCKKYCSAAIMFAVASAILPANVNADSWGSSWGGSSGGGSWGGSSGGSHGGGGGLFGGRQPIRNLLGRIGDRFHGGRGGSSGGSSGGSTGFAYGSHGSTGISYSSVGSSYGSMGSSYGSMGSSFGSTGSMGVSYGSVGAGYGSVGSVPIASYSAPMYSAPMYSAPMNGQILYDSGSAPSMGTSNGDTFQPVPGIYYEGGSGTPIPTNQGGGGEFQPPTPPAGLDGSTGMVPQSTTVLNLQVPTDAIVYINDHKTKTTGENRRYVSRNLKSGREYYYQVKAVVVRDGQEIVRNELITLKAGNAELVAFDFSQSVTSLAIIVPENAKVILCGKETNARGDARHFSTTKLEEGQIWSDYIVEVEVEKDGRLVRQEKKLNLVGGETYQLKFEFDEAGELLAVR